jgi:hypothetical protein
MIGIDEASRLFAAVHWSEDSPKPTTSALQRFRLLSGALLTSHDMLVVELSTAEKRFHPMVSARLSVALHPIGAGILALFGASTAGGFTILRGAGSGILTIARGTLPLAMFGPENYGYRLGLLGAPSRVAMAAPLLFGAPIERYGAGVLLFSSGLSVAAFLALCMLSATSR